MSWLGSARKRAAGLRARVRELFRLPNRIAEAEMLMTRIFINQMKAMGPLRDVRQAEFKVSSQFGEDGIIQYLVWQTGIQEDEKRFVEFGVENYEEANTRFLLENDNWRGLILDGDGDGIESVRNEDLYWRHDLTALHAFIDAENINALITSAGCGGDIGLLSIDVDGNDYWIWKAIDCVRPVIVAVEYNSVFGPERAVTIPYDPSFVRTVAHHSTLYWGCSLKALEVLGASKGYALVCSNSAGNNAFFVRRDRLGNLPVLSAREAYVESKYRESRDSSGRLTYLSGQDRIRAITEMPVYDVALGRIVHLAEIAGAAEEGCRR
jgi:hypothetical protein